VLQALAVLLVLTAFFAWVNERTVRLPTTIGVTLAGAISALVLITLDETVGIGAVGWAAGLLETLDFTEFVLGGILSALLFAGALGLDTREMWVLRRAVLTLAFGSTVLSTLLLGAASYAVFRMLGLELPLVWAFLFGALISPTDPVAVLDMLKRARVPKKLETLIAGESLFNDGIGIVLFLVLGALAGTGVSDVEPTLAGATGLFLQQAVGGVAFGAVIGALGYYFTKSIDGGGAEVLITLAMVVGGYAAAETISVSGPLAMVVAGLVMSHFKEVVFAERTRELVEGFWEILDELLNVILFTLIGLNVLLAEGNATLVLASAILVVVALVVRFTSVAMPMAVLRHRGHYGPWTTRLLTWGGLRGGIAIGLALSLPAGEHRDIILTPTFAIVLFSIVVQGLTVMMVVRRAVVADTA
jgi:CPA1 family monovalent cation:H+ antiporter